MRTELLDYELPEELIAVHPPPERDGARMLILGRALQDSTVKELPGKIPEGALVVLNDTRVFRARLLGKRPEGGSAELLLMRKRDDDSWVALGKPARKMRPGMVLDFGSGLRGEVLERHEDEVWVTLSASEDDDVARAIERVGHVPIPPYLRRADEPEDAIRYQTVYARAQGSVAAPTAGLHFTDQMFARLGQRNIEIARLTLHVGPGTFKPVTAEDLDDHSMHVEHFELAQDIVDAIERARERHAPVVAIGTTVVRALESAADPERAGHVRSFAGETRILIQPGHRFRVVNALFTNFHMPRSTLLALVAAFAGLERTRAAYAHAIRERYRFLSYGDAMWIPAILPDS